MKRAAHLRALDRFAKRGGDYVLIGLMAINHYAQDASEVFLTADLDVLLAPRARNLRKACEAFLEQGYELSCNDEPLGEVDDWLCRRIVQRRGVVQARMFREMSADLVTMSGSFPYSAWKRGSRVFKAHGVTLRVGDLAMLLEAKRRAGRPKDEAFLTMYEAHRRTRELEAKAGRSRAGRSLSARAGAPGARRRARRSPARRPPGP